MRQIVGALVALCWVTAPVRAALLSDATSVAGDSISRGFNADTGSCNYGDNTSRSWSSGDNHGSSFCSAGSGGTFSAAERLECEKGGHVTIFNDAASGADMVSDFFNQASAIRSNLSSAPGPRLVNILMGHNDACTSTTSRSGNGCGGDRDPNNYCRTTNQAFEREFRRGMDELIQIPSSRIAVYATIRVSQLCNFESKNGCGISFGLPCDTIWGLGSLVLDIFGSGGGICASLTKDCSSQRRIDMYNTLLGYNEVLERVANEYAAIPVGGQSATGAVRASDVAIGYFEGSFYYKFASNDVSCCDCFHPSDAGQSRLADFAWNGLECSTSVQCCGQTSDPLAGATCGITDTWSTYPGGFWAGGVTCGNGVLDPGEQCDDGNAVSGDCCTAACEVVAAGTACASDGNQCTDNMCDGAGACVHPAVTNGTACDDGLFCDGSDTCVGGVCVAESIDPCLSGSECADLCDEVNDTCFDPAGVPCADDAEICTDDVCDGNGSCAHLANTLPCDDGMFCNGVDRCGGGTCSLHTGDPCASLGECANVCDDTSDTCFVVAGTSCGDDGSVCTDDFCNGVGACIHPNNSAPCDDSNVCTAVDVCSGGVCVGGAPVQCGDCRTCDPFAGCGGPICTATPLDTHTPTLTPTVPATPSPVVTATATLVPTATPAPSVTAPPSPTPDLCSPLPRPSCLVAAKSRLLVKNEFDDRRDRLIWKLIGGESTSQADFGDPTSSTAYSLCLYDAGGLFGRLDAVASGARWKALGTRGYKYRDPAEFVDGLQKIKLLGSDRDRTKILWKARGEFMPRLAIGLLPAPITVQMVRGDATLCWESVFAAADVSRNLGDQLKASSSK